MPSNGRKLDGGKPRWSLLPPGFVRAVVDVLEYGAAKYDVDNWKNVADARRRYYDAVNRHLEAWWNGEFDDPESGLPHLAHAACSISFLLWFEVHGYPTPARPAVRKPAKPRRHEQARARVSRRDR